SWPCIWSSPTPTSRQPTATRAGFLRRVHPMGGSDREGPEARLRRRGRRRGGRRPAGRHRNGGQVPYRRPHQALSHPLSYRGGHTRNHGEAPVRRACYAADRTGHMILQTLYQQCVARDVSFFNEFQVLDIAFADGRVAAVVAYELATGDLHVFECKAALFATGGFGRMFKVSSNAVTLTGDGPGVLYRRGVPMEDMEFFQFHPTGIYKLGI